jgi:hypothetical protein
MVAKSSSAAVNSPLTMACSSCMSRLPIVLSYATAFLAYVFPSFFSAFAGLGIPLAAPPASRARRAPLFAPMRYATPRMA